MTGQRVEPSGRHDAVAVEEGHEGAAGGTQTGVARSGRSGVRLLPQDRRAVSLTDGEDGCRVEGSVVDNEHAHAPDRLQAPLELDWSVEDRDDDRDVDDRLRIGPGVGEPAVDEGAHQPEGRPVVHGRSQLEASAAVPQPEQAHRVAAEQDGVPGEATYVPVQHDRQARRELRTLASRAHRARPPSTGSTAPVTAAAAGPASQSSAAATSKGWTNRSIGCCRANPSDVGRP